jgi:hypothetical protein
VVGHRSSQRGMRSSNVRNKTTPRGRVGGNFEDASFEGAGQGLVAARNRVRRGVGCDAASADARARQARDTAAAAVL